MDRIDHLAGAAAAPTRRSPGRFAANSKLSKRPRFEAGALQLFAKRVDQYLATTGPLNR